MKVKIIRCNAVGPEFVDIKPGSIHEVVPAPKKYPRYDGVWVMGKSEEVRLLEGEYIVVQDD